jgi:hypothetical protein
MNNKKFTITADDINATSTGTPWIERCDISGSTPRNVYFINNCGKDIEINFLATGERTEFNNDTTTFVGILVPDGTTFSSKDILESDVARIIDYLLIVKAEAGDATADLDIYCLDYI